jgi:hypothetical protein
MDEYGPMRREVIDADHRDGGEWMDWGCRVLWMGKRDGGAIKGLSSPGEGGGSWYFVVILRTDVDETEIAITERNLKKYECGDVRTRNERRQ